MLRSDLCHYSDVYKLVSATIKIPNTATKKANNRKNVIIKNCPVFTDCISDLNNTQTDNAKDIDIVTIILKRRILWNCYRDEPFLDNGAIIDFPTDNKLKAKIAGGTENNSTKNVKIRVPLKNLSNFSITIEMPSINCEINLVLTRFKRYFVIDNPIVNQEPTLTITETKLYVPDVILSIQDNAKLLWQLKPGFKRKINWNRYELKLIDSDEKNI